MISLNEITSPYVLVFLINDHIYILEVVALWSQVNRVCSHA